MFIKNTEKIKDLAFLEGTHITLHFSCQHFKVIYLETAAKVHQWAEEEVLLLA